MPRPVIPPSAILSLMSQCHLARNQCPERGSLPQNAACKNATTKRTQASRLPQVAKYHICKAHPRASSPYTARTTQLNPEKRTHRLGSNRIPIPSRPTRRKRVTKLQHLHPFSSSYQLLTTKYCHSSPECANNGAWTLAAQPSPIKAVQQAKILSDSRGG
jgi:hypothetical protein